MLPDRVLDVPAAERIIACAHLQAPYVPLESAISSLVTSLSLQCLIGSRTLEIPEVHSSIGVDISLVGTAYERNDTVGEL